MSNIKDLLIQKDDLLLQVEHQKNYLQYLRGWYKEHIDKRFKDMEPLSFEDYCDGKEKEIIYVVKVTINESNHAILSFNEQIEVVAPSGLRMDQLKQHIESSEFPIESFLKPTTSTLDYVEIKIYDYDLDLIQIKVKEKVQSNETTYHS